MSEQTVAGATFESGDEEDSLGRLEAEQVGRKRQKSSRPPTTPRSMVWQHFSKLENNIGKSKCNYCGKEYACGKTTSGSTTNMKKHLAKCKAYENTLVDESQPVFGADVGDGSEHGSTVVSWGWSQDACRKALVKMIIIDELPFAFVENKGFRHFCGVSVPRFDVPSRRTISRDAMQLFLDEKAILKSMLSENKKRVCLTTDIWTSIQKLSYMVITCHFIDSNWRLHRRILSFATIEDHRGDTIGKRIEACLLDWGIERVFTITVDNASANDVAVNYVTRKLRNWKDDGLVLDGEYMHVRCCAHILNLIVSDGLKEHNASIESIRNAVKYVRSSTARMLTFKQCVEHERIEFKGSLIMDCPTRWNSTYLMLATALKFQTAFDRMAEQDRPYDLYFKEDENGNRREGPPAAIDWANADRFVKFLKTFYDATLNFSSSLSVTSNLCYNEVANIQNMLSSLAANRDPLLGNMAKIMKVKYDKYWESTEKINKLLIISTLLDPRCKMGFVEFIFGGLYANDNDSGKVVEMKRMANELLIKLYETYAGWHSKPSCDDSIAIGSGTQFSEDLADESPFVRYTKMSKNKYSMDVSNEVDKYLTDVVEDPANPNFNILLWWRLNSTKYPILAHIASDVLAIPVSTVASESAFSTGGRVLDQYRSSLTPKMVEALICAQNWLRSQLLLDSTVKLETLIEEYEFYEKIEAEFIKATQPEHSTVA